MAVPRHGSRDGRVQTEAAIVKGYGLGFIGMLLFSLSLPATRMAVPELGPEFVTAARLGLGGLLAASYLTLARKRPPERRHWRDLGLIVLGVVGLFPLCTALAMRDVEASHGGVVLAILPLLTAATGALVAGERPSGRFWLAALGGTGVVLAFVLQRSGGAVAAADLYLLVAGIGAALGYAGGARIATRLPALDVIAWALAIALPATALLSLVYWPAAPAAVSPQAWGAVVFVAAFPQFIAFFFWYGGLALGGIGKVGQLQLLQVYCTLGFSALLLGERTDLATWLAALLTVLFVWLARRAPVRRATEGRAHVKRRDA
jgi:drug/metabolite transporter (DMT)-like permease